MCQAHSSDHGGPKIIASEELKIGFYAPAFLNWNLFVRLEEFGQLVFIGFMAIAIVGFLPFRHLRCE